MDEIHEIISFGQNKWLENYTNFKTQERKKAKKDFEKVFYKLLNKAFYGKTIKKVRNRLRLEFIKKYEYK